MNGLTATNGASVASALKLDRLTVRSGFPIGAVIDVGDPVQITLSNANGVIYSAELLPGDLVQRGRALVFTDRGARSGNGIRGGLAKVKIQDVPRGGGVRILIDAFASLGGATEELMTLTIVVGDDANSITGTWEQRRFGWYRFHR